MRCIIMLIPRGTKWIRPDLGLFAGTGASRMMVMKGFLPVLFLIAAFTTQAAAGLVVGADATEVQALAAEGAAYTLYRLNPTERKAEINDEKFFRGFGIVGQAAIDAKTGQSLIVALVQAVQRPEPTAFCFNPGFGLSVRQGGQVRDLVICFECRAMVAYGMKTTHFPISSQPLDLFLKTAEQIGRPALSAKP